MYRLGHQIRHHYGLYFLSLIVMGGLIIGGVIFIRHLFTPRTVITQSEAVTHYYSGSNTPTQQINEQLFSVVLPASWKTASNPGSPYTIYSWQGSGADADRRIDIYIDNVPVSFAVNRLQPVQVNTDQLQPLGSVSDNCTTFTTPTTQSAQTGTIEAKWNGIDFLCDTGNYERDVVAIGADTATITLTGPKTGSHKILLVYTDDSAQPDYTIFSSIIQSFQIL